MTTSPLTRSGTNTASAPPPWSGPCGLTLPPSSLFSLHPGWCAFLLLTSLSPSLQPRSCQHIPCLLWWSHSPAAALFELCDARVYVQCALTPLHSTPSGTTGSRGLYSSTVHRPLLLGPKGPRPWQY